ncbi:hypothetical protein [Superficieibacter electus]|uniref:hypothetical protein n=1 Tax=Superficieibacter electus TaxID=2022662 RepID=UPI0010573691|nr:hypothetical protein [Superficieibacter electus]
MRKKFNFINLCLLAGILFQPTIIYAKSVVTERTPLELSGIAADFFLNYIVPMAGFDDVNRSSYHAFYGKDDGKTITVYTESSFITHDHFYNNTSSPEIPELTKNRLEKVYCAPDKREFVLPSSIEGIFRQARMEEKTIMISYYDAEKQSLLFSIGVSPESCSHVNAYPDQPG